MSVAKKFRNPEGGVVVVSGTILTVPLEKEAAKALSDFYAAHQLDLELLLAPFGIGWKTILLPEWERYVTIAEFESWSKKRG